MLYDSTHVRLIHITEHESTAVMIDVWVNSVAYYTEWV